MPLVALDRTLSTAQALCSILSNILILNWEEALVTSF